MPLLLQPVFCVTCFAREHGVCGDGRRGSGPVRPGGQAFAGISICEIDLSFPERGKVYRGISGTGEERRWLWIMRV
jgi:hypothetical protein